MKKIFFYFIAAATLAVSSCDQSLDEVPLDFYTPENSYTNKANFESALANIYLGIRTNFYAAADARESYDMLGMDLDLANLQTNASVLKTTYFQWNAINADNAFAGKWWNRLYSIIAQTNTIIDRADQPTAVWASAAEKNAIVGEAKFLRAFAYHFLANMWGDVPLVLNETKTPKFDYVRAPQVDVYLQCKADLDFATQNMPVIGTLKGGRAPREAAYHLLSEVKIALKDYDGAIAAASAVIDGGKCGLMTARFGVNKNFTFTGYTYQGTPAPWGDVYWDLFQKGNMFYNQQGNREAIWNISQDPFIKGGNNTDVHAGGGLFVMERWWGPFISNAAGADGRKNGVMNILQGRPVAGIIVSDYASNIIWNYKGDFTKDIRNSQANIQRNFYYTTTNTASPTRGQLITKTNCDAPTLALWDVELTPHFKKFVSESPKNPALAKDATSGQSYDNGRTWKDWYIMRLAETYLLRAEAKMLKGDLSGAATDINAVRARSSATLVVAGDVNMDLILDERARELYGEEFRINTLYRTGKLVEYMNKYNGYLLANGLTAVPRASKLPIPRAQIEANTGAKMENNTGY